MTPRSFRTVAGLDESRKRIGIGSRSEFFRRAVHADLEGAGANDTAARFAPEV